MLFTTPGQVVILAVLLLAGWMLGYASAPGAKKWRRRVRAQSDSFTAYHTDAEDKLRAANQRAVDLKNEADALRSDKAEADRTIARLRVGAAASEARSATRPPVETPAEPLAADDPVAEAAPEIVQTVPDPQLAAEIAPEQLPVHSESHAAPALLEPPGPEAVAPEPPARGWFGSSGRDDLTRLRGIDGMLATRLFGLGVVRFEDIEKLSAEDEMALEQRLALPAGIIAREQWRAQAALLRAGQNDTHAAQFGAVEALPER